MFGINRLKLETHKVDCNLEPHTDGNTLKMMILGAVGCDPTARVINIL